MNVASREAQHKIETQKVHQNQSNKSKSSTAVGTKSTECPLTHLLPLHRLPEPQLPVVQQTTAGEPYATGGTGKLPAERHTGLLTNAKGSARHARKNKYFTETTFSCVSRGSYSD